MAALAVTVWMGSRLLTNPAILPPDDFVEYWAAGSLNAQGKNPYDGELLLPLERYAGRNTDEAIMMWNPPWTLTLAMPIGLIKPRPAQLIWLAVSFILVIGCADRLWADYGGPTERRWISWLLALTFVPTLFVLNAGQIGPFILLGIAGFLFAERIGLPWLAGACGVLMAIKPHLVYLFWIALAGWVVKRPLPTRWKVVVGGVLAGLAATAIPLACNPDVLGEYWEAMRYRTPDQWKSPTIGSYLREWTEGGRFGLQFAPTALGLAWLAYHALAQHRRPWIWAEQMPLLLLVSFVTASYGAWPFDLVILLPAVIHVAAGLTRVENKRSVLLAIALYGAINVAALAGNALGATSDKFVWMAPSLLIAYLILRPKSAAS